MLISPEQKIKIDEFLKFKDINYKFYNYKNLSARIEFENNISFEILEGLFQIFSVNKSSILIKSFNNQIYVIIK